MTLACGMICQVPSRLVICTRRATRPSVRHAAVPSFPHGDGGASRRYQVIPSPNRQYPLSATSIRYLPAAFPSARHDRCPNAQTPSPSFSSALPSLKVGPVGTGVLVRCENFSKRYHKKAHNPIFLAWQKTRPTSHAFVTLSFIAREVKLFQGTSDHGDCRCTIYLRILTVAGFDR